MGLVLFGWKPKKFGKNEALTVLETNPTITSEIAKAGLAFVGALKIPVVVMSETEETVRELMDGLVAAAADLEETTTKIMEIEQEGNVSVAVIKERSKARIVKVANRFLDDVAIVREKYNNKIDYLAEKIRLMAERREGCIDELQKWCDATEKSLRADLAKAVAKIQTKNAREIANLREEILDTRESIEDDRAKLVVLEKVKAIFG